MGKNFSCNNASKKRKKSDFYETPYSLTRLLLREEWLEEPILEPACGNGAIVKILKEYNHRGITYYDKEQNFLIENYRYPTIITNPPFSIAYDFILKAKKIATKKIIFLLPLSYLHGKKRYDNIYSDEDFPLKCIYVFTRYPMLGDELREDGLHRTGMMVYAWFVWEKYWKEKPTIKWLDNDPFVLRKKQ